MRVGEVASIEVKGVKVEYKKLSITQVKLAINKNGAWRGIVAGSKVAPWSLENGWRLGSEYTFKSVKELQEYYNDFRYYSNRYLGNTLAFYSKVV